MKDILKERGRGDETDHFRKLDQQLVEKMRERARLADVAKALGDKLRVDDAELIERVKALGLDEQTGPAILLAPLVQVAWSDGSASDAEKAKVVELAESRGVEPGTPAHDKLLSWLKVRPSDAVFETATECMRLGFAVLEPAERDERIKALVAACRQVAEASGGSLGKLLGLSDGVSGDEERVLDAISKKLRAGTASRV
jgi:tellurite resistance protein